MSKLPALRPRLNLWLEAEEEVALSRWRVELLQAVDRSGSISAAAEAKGIQYRLAWERIHEMEDRLGVSLVDTTAGGVGGGGSTLTPIAHTLIEQFLDMVDAVDRFTIEHFHLFLGSVTTDTERS